MILGHCRDGYHAYCGGETRDRGDGSMVECECRCHRRPENDLLRSDYDASYVY